MLTIITIFIIGEHDRQLNGAIHDRTYWRQRATH